MQAWEIRQLMCITLEGCAIQGSKMGFNLNIEFKNCDFLLMFWFIYFQKKNKTIIFE